MAEDCEGEFMYGTCIPSRSCSYIMRIPRESRCDFIHQVEDCKDNDALFWYMGMIACHFNHVEGQMYLGLVVVFLLACVYFIFLSYAADFFTPSLCYISNSLGLSESFAGATLLALGNAAPDIFTSLVGAMKLGFHQIVAQVLGAGMFLSTVVVAAIIMVRPFKVCAVSFLKNLLTYMLSLALLIGVYVSGRINLALAIVFLLLYATYIALYVVRGIHEGKAKIKELVEKVVEEEDSAENIRMVRKESLTMSELSYIHETDTWSLDGLVKKPMDKEVLQLKRRETTPVLHRQRLTWAPHVLDQLNDNGVEFPTRLVSREIRGTSLNGIANSSLEVERSDLLREFGQRERARRSTMLNANVVLVEIWGTPVVRKHNNLVTDFFLHMSPIDVDDWQEMSTCCRIITALLAPMVLISKVLIPCVDESIVCNNWCKLLFMFQCVYLPAIMAWSMSVTKTFSVEVYVPVLVSVTLLGVAVAGWVFVSSHVNEAPPYHMAIAVLGFLVAIMFIYLLACEVLSILVTIGQVLSISTVTLAMTLMPWGNTIADLVNSISLARAGFPRMAHTGVYGSNVLMVLLGVGIFFLLMITKGATLVVKRGNPELISDTFFLLAVVCIANLIIVPTFDFQMRKSFAVFLIIMYAMYIPFCVLTELDLVNAVTIPHHSS